MGASGTAKILLIKSDGREFQLGTSVDTSPSWIITKPLDFGDASLRKMIQRMVMDIAGSSMLQTFTLTISSADNEDDAFVEETPISIDSTTLPVNFRPPARRYFKFKFTDAAVLTFWKLASFEVFGTIAGRRM